MKSEETLVSEKYGSTFRRISQPLGRVRRIVIEVGAAESSDKDDGQIPEGCRPTPGMVIFKVGLSSAEGSVAGSTLRGSPRRSPFSNTGVSFRLEKPVEATAGVGESVLVHVAGVGTGP